MSDHGHDAAAPSTFKKLTTVAVLIGLPVVLIATMVANYRSVESGGPASMSEDAVAARLQKVGMVTIGSAVHEPRSGEQVFKAQCTTCHTAGMLGAPKFGDAAAWAPRLGQGFEGLLKSALKGKGNMTAQGGGAFSDDEVGRAVVYMANAAGGKLAEPKQ